MQYIKLRIVSAHLAVYRTNQIEIVHRLPFSICRYYIYNLSLICNQQSEISRILMTIDRGSKNHESRLGNYVREDTMRGT